MRSANRVIWCGLLLAALFTALLTALMLAGCSRSPRADERWHLAAGKTFFDKKDYARAALEFKNAIQAAPADAEPYYRLALVFIATDNAQAAIYSLRKATELDPKHKEAQLQFAQLMAAHGSREVVEQAEQRALQVLSASGENAEALNTMALAEARLGKPESAERYLQRALRQFPEDLRSSVSLAQLKLLAGDLAGAEEVLRQAVAQASAKATASNAAGSNGAGSNTMPQTALGDFYVTTGRPALARPLFEEVLRRDAQNGLAMLGLASVELQAGHIPQAEALYRRVSALPQDDYKPVYGLYLFQSGRRAEAIPVFRQLAHDHPNDRGARSRLVLAYLATAQYGEAEKVLAEALARSPKDVDALLGRSALRLSMGRAAEAQMDLAQVLRNQPDSAEAHFFLARAHRMLNAPLTQRQELAEALRLNPQMLAARLELAESLVTSHLAEKALQLMDEAPAGQHGEPAWIVQRNWALMELGRLEDARKEVDRGLAQARTSDLLLQDGVLKSRGQNYAAGRAAIEEGLRQSPEDPRLLAMLMQTYEARKEVPAALERLRQHAEMFPGSPYIQQFMGNWLNQLGRTAESRRAYAAAKAADPKFTWADISLAQLDISENNLDAARQRLAGVVARESGNVTARLWLGQVEEISGNVNGAISQYRKILDSEPNNVVALNNLAYYLADQANQPDEALKYAQRVKEIAPDSAAVDDTIGWAFYRKGIYLTAIKHLETAAAQAHFTYRGGMARAKYHLAMAYFKSGNLGSGDRAMQEAVEADPNLPEHPAAQKIRLEAGPKAR